LTLVTFINCLLASSVRSLFADIFYFVMILTVVYNYLFKKE